MKHNNIKTGETPTETKPGDFSAWVSSWRDRHGIRARRGEKAGAALPGLGLQYETVTNRNQLKSWGKDRRGGLFVQGSGVQSSMYTVCNY